jgi:competence protein ComGC
LILAPSVLLEAEAGVILANICGPDIVRRLNQISAIAVLVSALSWRKSGGDLTTFFQRDGMKHKNTGRTLRVGEASAFTLVELVAIICLSGVIMILVVPAFAKDYGKISRLRCGANLKNIGLAFHTFAINHGNRYPMNIPVAEGGSSEYTAVIAAQSNWVHFAIMSNELVTPKILVCPTDGAKTIATNFTFHMGALKNRSISYIVGFSADETRSQVILSGDRNITNAIPVRFDIDKSEIIKLGTNHSVNVGASWNRDLHQNQGNILLAGGSVHFVNPTRLREQLRTSDSENRIAFPGQSPK